MLHGNLGIKKMKLKKTFWNNRRVFLTGHTGFKGSWLSLWLQSMGVNLRGYALSPPTEPSLFYAAKIDENMDSIIGDIRDYNLLNKAIADFKPELIIHMAAQPLVRLSYIEPMQTYQTNVMGTVNLMESVRQLNNPCGVLNVTTDKCYENREWLWGYRENDNLGGFDPYSNSKACSELITDAYRKSFFESSNIPVASARAGNVIGGGDWARDRLIPDLIGAFNSGKPSIIRSPKSIRPWQHVIEPLYGYLLLAEQLGGSNGMKFSEAWNFGPNENDAKSVEWIANYMMTKWGKHASWKVDDNYNPHETNALRLDSSKSRERLGWKSRWDLAEALDAIIEWNELFLTGSDMREITLSQVNTYVGGK